MNDKFCKRCNTTKPIEEFSRNKSKKDGFQFYCKDCSYKFYRHWVKGNKHKLAPYLRSWRSHYCRTGRARAWELRKKARDRGTKFNMTLEEFAKWFDAQERCCYYCGRQVFEYNELPKDQKHLLSLTIDRKDNSKPYMIDNIAIACGRCNWMKGAWLTEEQMLDAANRYFK